MRTEVETEAEVEAREAVAHEDVDDIIEIAARMKQADADRLTVEELEEVARDLDIEPEYVKRAVATLEERREAARLAARQEQATRRKVLAGVGAVAAVIVLALGVMAMIGRGGLTSRMNAAEARRAQVVNVVERQRNIEAKLADGAPTTLNRDAELIGSENRVRVEARRYDQAASEYNTYASSLTGGVARAIWGMPERLPLSPELETW